MRRPGFDRVRTMDRIGLAAALIDEGDLEWAAAAGHQTMESAGMHSALVASRLNTLLPAVNRHQVPEIAALHSRAADVAARLPVPIGSLPDRALTRRRWWQATRAHVLLQDRRCGFQGLLTFWLNPKSFVTQSGSSDC